MYHLRQSVRYCTCGHTYWLLNWIWNFSQLVKCGSSTTHSLSKNPGISVKIYLDYYFHWAVGWPQLSTKSSHLISNVCESMWKVWCAIRMWKHAMHCSVAVHMLQPFKGQSYWTDASYSFSSQMCQVMLKHTWIHVWAASAWQYSREFFSGPLFIGINLLFVSSFTTKCSSLGTCALNKCKFQFNKFNCGNISNVQQVYAFFFTYFVCVALKYLSIARKYLIFLFGNGT